MIESLLVKIGGAILKKGLATAGLQALASAYEVYSLIDDAADLAHCVRTASDCHELSICGLHVMSDPLSDAVIGQLLDLGGHTFTIQQRRSGVYLAHSLGPTFSAPSLNRPMEKLQYHLRSLSNTRLENRTLEGRRLSNRRLPED
jgi:hypothetical protein